MDKTPDVAQLSYCCGKPLVWTSTANEGGEVDGWGSRCPGCGMEWQVLPKPARLLLPTEQMLLARIAELEAANAELLATLANERGEGEPPVPGWEWVPEEEQWALDGGFYAFRTDKGWTWDADRIRSGTPHYDAARDAMRAASGAS